MNAKYFIDTNIFVNTFDQGQPEKRERALALIAEALQSGDGLISSQVIQEFLNVATRKFTTPMKPADCQAYLTRVLHPLCQVYPDLALYETSLDIWRGNRLFILRFTDSCRSSARRAARSFTQKISKPGSRCTALQITNPFLIKRHMR